MTYRVGVIGAGQLARMLTPVAVNLDIELKVFAEAEGASAKLATTVVGDYTDAEQVLEFARGVDVITFDHEHVPQPVLQRLVEAGVAVRPGPQALRFAQDKIEMRQKVAELGLGQPEWTRATTADEVQAFVDLHGGRAIVKTPRGGYDGHGVRLVSSGSEVSDWLAAEVLDQVGGALLVEEAVDFRRELSQQVARRPSGEMCAWALAASEQVDGVCAEVIAPAPDTTDDVVEQARHIATTIAEAVEVTGALAVELFETNDGRVLVNELAMRPHNSGHWSMDGAVTGQFEQHLRAVLDLPLGDPEARQPVTVMVNVLGGHDGTEHEQALVRALAEVPQAKVHWYGKSYRPGRKMGHVNVTGFDLVETRDAARDAARALGSEVVDSLSV
ncbi:5-(carboxyamino)imidazole ribonucleotide synthase [Pseudoclavibacter sp. CFCC 11306]|uniref:5-(carboxyamino)imidazole ribonucleotide synthase n=1 Tax=Pseudoclavibacter sp. CFCC 11306 TaxID=1564493 RepID=UPI00130186B4|nr:5-(carboxyamino)imidazole ribonucleotide synthase [Pseudoclavibacter sp. CFCC 11306]KAB1657035.1 5-(carboxyamino)imidazole ribonucleotide synthase [Pseudoclavibacter sp. CFCC 11306]